MSLSSRKKKEHIFCAVYFIRREFFQDFFYLNEQCIEYTFRMYILLHIKKYYFIHFFCWLLKWSKAFKVSLKASGDHQQSINTISGQDIISSSTLKVELEHNAI